MPLRVDKRLKNLFELLQYQFQDLTIFSLQGVSRWIAVGVPVAVMLVSSVVLLSIKDLNELPKILISAPLAIVTALLSFLMFRAIRIYIHAHDRDRGLERSFARPLRDADGKSIVQAPYFPLLDLKERIKLTFDEGAYYVRRPYIEDMISWHDTLFETAFVMARGALDRPKISLTGVEVTRPASGGAPTAVTLKISGCSYYDKFCLHDMANLPLSHVPIGNVRKGPQTTFNKVFGEGAMSHYQRSLGTGGSFDTFRPLPNALGTSGVFRARSEEEHYWLLQLRQEDADHGLLDCSFAGLIEFEDFLDGRELGLADLFESEMIDELTSAMQSKIEEHPERWQPVAIIFSRHRLFQPEILALWDLPIDNTVAIDLLKKKQPGNAAFMAVAERDILQAIDTMAADGTVQMGGKTLYLKDNVREFALILRESGMTNST
jgi:hypothetical protein